MSIVASSPDSLFARRRKGSGAARVLAIAGVLGVPLAACGLQTTGYDWDPEGEVAASASTSSSGGAGGASTSASGGGASSSSAGGSSGASASSSSGSSSSAGSSSGGGPVDPAVFVQVAYATPQQNQSSAKAKYSKAQIAGNTNILAIGWNDTTSALVSVADTSGNTYQQALGTFKSATMSQAIYYASNIDAAAANGNEVTVTFNAAAQYIDLRITEYSGLNNVSPVDVSTSKGGKGFVASTDAITTTGPVELLFAAGMTRVVFTGPGLGYTQRVITNPDGDIVEDKIAFLPGLASASATLSDGEWLLQLVAFRPAP